MKRNEPKRLYRSREDKVIAGVCGGIAEYFNTDPIWIRLAAVLLFFIQGIGLLLYVLAWVFVPENPNQRSSKKTQVEQVVADVSKSKKPRSGNMLTGLVLLAVGVIFLMNNLFGINWDIMWPVLLIALGVYMIARRQKK
jgi:phage shock protein C